MIAMFRSIIKLTKNCAKQQTRDYARRAPSQKYIPNAGIRHRLAAETTEFETDSQDYDDDLAEYESEFKNTREIYKEHLRETKTQRERTALNIVRNKYFDERMPSFLTWGEMEQIRQLNEEDPEKWDDEKLSESFPADVFTIRKVLKSKWKPSDSERVAKFDQKVRSNWDSLAKGEFTGMNERFRQHLQKFSKRKFIAKVDLDSVLKKKMPKPEGTEFLGIITSCKKYRAEPKQISSKSDENTSLQPKELPAKFVTPKGIEPNKLYTFKRTSTEENVRVNSRTTDIIFANPSGTGVKQRNKVVTKFESNEIQLKKEHLNPLTIPAIRQHIAIPPKLFQDGATYRLGDCYYDDDGEFLYRVPGMTKL